jgi:hypothetical protein
VFSGLANATLGGSSAAGAGAVPSPPTVEAVLAEWLAWLDDELSAGADGGGGLCVSRRRRRG